MKATIATLTDAAEILGMSRPSVYKLIEEGKLFPFVIGDYKFISVPSLKPYIVHKCKTCFHYQNSYCACREVEDMIKKNCPDWTVKDA